MKLKNKVTIITGATSGIGEACATLFGREGAKVVITGRSQAKIDNSLLKLQQLGIEAIGILADSALESDNKKIAEETIRYFGKIDILINNAGISMRALFEDLDMAVFHQVMDVNFWGTVNATKFCLAEII